MCRDDAVFIVGVKKNLFDKRETPYFRFILSVCNTRESCKIYHFHVYIIRNKIFRLNSMVNREAVVQLCKL